MSASWTEKRNRFGGLGVYTVIYLAFIYGPVLVLPVFSFRGRRRLDADTA